MNMAINKDRIKVIILSIVFFFIGKDVLYWQAYKHYLNERDGDPIFIKYIATPNTKLKKEDYPKLVNKYIETGDKELCKLILYEYGELHISNGEALLPFLVGSNKYKYVYAPQNFSTELGTMFQYWIPENKQTKRLKEEVSAIEKKYEKKAITLGYRL